MRKHEQMEKEKPLENKTEQKKEIKTMIKNTTEAKAEKKENVSPSRSKTPSSDAKITKDKIALILVRGFVRTKGDIIATLYALRLRKKNSCVVLGDTPSNRASAMKCKDYITFGEINDETHKLLVEKRGRKGKDGQLQKFFSLHPPRGGFERKGIKTPFSNGGALGNRGPKINDLIKKML